MRAPGLRSVLALGLVALVALVPPGLALGGHAQPSAAAAIRPSTGGAGLNTSAWTNLTPTASTAPAGRAAAQSAYFPPQNELVVFGGLSNQRGIGFGDTWTFSSGRWTEVESEGGPPVRWSGGLVYDPALDGLLLFGGRNITTYFNDTWVYNATGWHELFPAESPRARAFFAMVYDPAGGYVLLFGGGVVLEGGVAVFNDTWEFANGDWTNVTATAGVAPRGGQVEDEAAYDAATQEVVLIGGIERLVGCPFPAVYDQTWTFHDGGWSRLSTPGGSPPSGRGAVFYDPTTNTTFYLIGEGNLTSGVCQQSTDQLWTLTGATWSRVPSAGAAPIGRVNPAVAWDPTLDSELLFGGDQVLGTSEGGPFVDLHDTWSFAQAPGYSVTFTESGAPSSLIAARPWTVVLDGSVVTSPTSTLVVGPIANGTYPVLVVGPPGYRASGSGTLTVQGSTAVSVAMHRGSTVSLRFHLKTPALETATPWCEAVDGFSRCTSGATIVFSGLDPGATYTYLTTPPTQGYGIAATVHGRAQGGSGTLTPVRSETVQISLVYLFPLEFFEHGLPRGTWSVTVHGLQRTREAGLPITFNLTNGSYRYRIGAEVGYTVDSVPVPALVWGPQFVSVWFNPKDG